MSGGAPGIRPSVHPSPVSLPFWEACQRHELLLQQCSRCGSFIFYPRSTCPFCGSLQLTWRVASGRGILYTFTVARRPTHRAFAEAIPYAIGVVELAEGPRMTSSIVSCPIEALEIGLPLAVDFEDGPEVTLPIWRPEMP